MTPERWQQIKGVLDQALGLKPEQRAAFLDRACEGDQRLRQEVESLLAAGEEGRSSFLQSPPMMQLAKGTRLGDYQIQSLLGAGGMGEVYRARDLRLRRDVAIKVLPAFVASDPERLWRFEQEATAAAALNHPNILAVFQMGTHEGAPYLVSELLEGETLREQLSQGRMVVRNAIDYAVQIARGLAAAHEKAIVHRDLKPENLFVTREGRVKILDFGLAKLMQPQPGSEHSAPTMGSETVPGLVMGTVGYMSPEQVRGQSVDHRADIFAFGAILYEMLAGKRAFQKDTAAETMVAILKEDPPSHSQIVPNLPPALQSVVHRCLEKKPEQRFQSASDLAFALAALTDAPKGEKTAAATTSSGSLIHSRRLLWGLVAIIALVGGAFLAWRSLSPRSSDAAPIHSIAVLPFANASKDPEMEYFGDGLAGEITNSLSRLPNLQVMARSTVSRYKSRQDDPQGVGHDLHVDAVLTGRVVEHGNEINVETELVNVATGTQLWGDRYTRSASDASLLQAAITRDVASQLRPQLGSTQQQNMGKVGTKDAEAYRLYLKGRYRFDKGSEVDMKEAAGFFEQAVARDPTYAAAYAGLADAFAMQGYFGYVSDPAIFERARSVAHKSLDLDSQISEPHVSLAIVDLIYFWNFREAEQEIHTALSLDPNSANTHEVFCWFHLVMGKLEDAKTECSRAVALEPISIQNSAILSQVYWMRHEGDRALEQAQKALEIDPSNEFAEDTLAYAYQAAGDYTKEVNHWIKVFRLRGEQTRAREEAQAFEKGGYPAFLRTDARFNEAKGAFGDAAGDYAQLGDKDAAFAALEKAFPGRTGLFLIKVDPQLDNIRSDPRYAALLRRIGLPQ
jgi:serine/threonine-protein kinase